jgi:hypothetical protein
MILSNSFLKCCLTLLILLLFANLSLYSKGYKTIIIKKDIINSVIINKSSFPKSNPTFTFLVKRGAGLTSKNDLDTFRKTNKIVLFRINLKDYEHSQKLFLIIKSQMPTNEDIEKPLISAFYDTSSKVSIVPEKSCNYHHELINVTQQVSFKVDTNFKFLYLLMAFPDSFKTEFTYSILCKPKSKGDKKQFDIYHHQYDYDRQPSFFMESSFFESHYPDYYDYSSVNLNDPGFEKPHLIEGSDSLFYNKWMTKFIELAEIDTSFAADCSPPPIPIELHYDSTGNLVHYQVSDMNNLVIQPHIKALIRLLIESLPNTFTWTPALDNEGNVIEYKRKLIFSSDFCWN